MEQVDKPEKGHHIVHFSQEQCGDCPDVGGCPVRCRKRFYSLSFNDRQVLLAQRRPQLSTEDYRQKCRLRPAIEGTISQFKRQMHNGKLRVRGLKKVRNSIILMAIGINFGRLWTYSLENNPGFALFLTFAVMLFVFLAKSLVEKSKNVEFEVG